MKFGLRKAIRAVQADLDHFSGVLCVNPLAESIHFRAYFETIQGAPLLKLCVDAVAASYPEMDLHILVHSISDECKLRDMLGHLNLKIHRAPYHSQIRVRAELARSIHNTHVAFFGIGILIAPADLLRRALSHHLLSNSEHTSVANFPRGIVSEIYSRRLLIRLGRAKLPLPVTDGQSALEFLRIAFGDRFKSTHFDAMASYGARPGDLPERIELRTPVEVARFKNVLEATKEISLSSSPLARIREWKKLRVAEAHAEELSWERQRKNCRSVEVTQGLRVLYVSNASATSGQQESLCDLISGFSSNEVRAFALVALPGAFTKRLESSGAQVICLGDDFSNVTEFNLSRLARILLEVRPNVVHIDCSGGGLSAAIASKLCQIPRIVHLRLADMSAYGEVPHAAELLIAVSNFVKSRFERLDIDPRRIKVVHDGISVDYFRRDKFDRTRARKLLGISPEPRVVAMIGRFTPMKRHDLAIQAFWKLRRSLKSALLLLVADEFGDREDRYFDYIREQIAACGLQDCIRITGFQPDIRVVHAASDVIIVPSEQEAFPRCI